jgi:hypothetical protein
MRILPRRDSGPAYLPEDWHRLARVLGVTLLLFCLGLALLAWWRDASVVRYLGPIAVTVGGFVLLGGLTVVGWRLIDRL